MSENKIKQPEKLVNFKIESDLYEKVFFIAREKYGHGGVKKLYNVLSHEFVAKYDSGTPKLNKWLDPNFTPKPVIYDNIEKNFLPYAANLDNTQLHELRVWCYQAYNVCMAYSKMGPNQRKNCKMTYDQLFDLVYQDKR